jgi:tetratricopeptide (TPR) repeat protein
MSSKKLSSLREVEEAFMKGHDFLLKTRYKKAIKQFERVIEFGESPYLSGAYVNLAKAFWEPDPLNPEKIEKAKGYIEQALKIKPTNEAAKSLAVPIYVSGKDFETAIRYFLQLKVPEAITQGLFFLGMMEPLAIKGDPSITKAISSIEQLYKKYKERWPKIGNIMAFAYISVEEYQKAYSTLKESMEIHKNDVTSYLYTCVNLSLLCTTYLANPKDGIRYAEKGIRMYKKQNLSFQKMNLDVIEKLETNLSMALLQMKEFNKVINILKPKIQNNPNNTDFHNIAFAYYKIGDYDNALKNCEKALYISTDEQSLFIKSRNIIFSKEI